MVSLYRFLNVNDYTVDMVDKQYLYFSDLKDFNDPFEELFIAKTNIPKPEYITDGRLISIHQKIRNYYPNAKVYSNEEFTGMLLNGVSLKPFKTQLLKLTFESIEEQYKLLVTNKKHCCFIQNNSSSETVALGSKLMWSHYANGLRGFVIEFDKSQLLECLKSDSDNHISSGDMFYGDLSTISALDTFEEFLEQGREAPYLSKVLTAKSSEWKYENEFRISSLKQKVNYETDCIKSVTFGEKMPKEKLQLLVSLFKKKGVCKDKLNYASINRTTYAIDVVPLLDEHYQN
ncbi:DUF2971 domain-containing protein [Vibrio alginolyticus]